MPQWLRWILSFAAIMLVALVAGIFLVSSWRINRDYAITIDPIRVPESQEAIDRGRYLADAVNKCTECHGKQLGGEIFIDDPALGRLVASNLTAGEGGVARRYTRDDWVRSIRHGVGPDGKPLLFMPAQEYNSLSDADLGALLAYVKSLPPVDSDLPDSRVGPLGRLLLLAGRLPLLPAELIDHDAKPLQAPPRGATADYGDYLVRTGGCTGCHGDHLSGGPIPCAPPDAPPAGNITPDEDSGIGSWSQDDFIQAMRTGKRPDGSSIDPFMPWKANGRMTDEDLSAIYLALREVEPREAGGR